MADRRFRRVRGEKVARHAVLFEKNENLPWCTVFRKKMVAEITGDQTRVFLEQDSPFAASRFPVRFLPFSDFGSQDIKTDRELPRLFSILPLREYRGK
jgi:hypothetical protein